MPRTVKHREAKRLGPRGQHHQGQVSNLPQVTSPLVSQQLPEWYPRLITVSRQVRGHILNTKCDWSSPKLLWLEIFFASLLVSHHPSNDPSP